ncbi:ATP-binding cassette domain-containing protein [Celerinatantimonas sp. YJH-8]|uniref:ATP-binding cassette domain-containing protein n=1 Tax=Celerinatantimonas sp. YJH-8 TaxID=3228714 RepID=UPI0038C4FAAF
MSLSIADQPLAEFIEHYPYTQDFFNTLDQHSSTSKGEMTLQQWIKTLNPDHLLEQGMERQQILDYLEALIRRMNETQRKENRHLQALTIMGGQNKSQKKEHFSLTLRPGEIASLVGPTGSGKSRLLADIECLAQRDTPSKRQILLNHTTPAASERFNLEDKLVAQISQNMNFVVDLSVIDFITAHARSRMVAHPQEVVHNIIECANQLTGEQFTPQTSITQLSGGQSRALMIADTALLSRSPIILIDEIENAGVDRKRAIELLVDQEKIVFIATHDPLLALTGTYRIVIKNGGIADVIATENRERRNIAILEALDNGLLTLRNRIRNGETITEPLDISHFMIH